MNNKKLIIKNLWVLGLFSVGVSASSLSHEEVNKMVQKIKEERVGIDLATLENTPNPFLIIKEEVKKEKPKEVKAEKPKVVKKVVTYNLVAILNHAAFIDGKWYKIGDKLGSYTLTNMGRDRVILKNDTDKRELVIPKREKKFKMFKGK